MLSRETRSRIASEDRLEIIWNSLHPSHTYIVWSAPEPLVGTWNEEATLPSQGATTAWTDSSPLTNGKCYRVEMK
jgi:hypothetical protein